MNLEDKLYDEKLNIKFAELDVARTDRDSISEYLSSLRDKDTSTYEHSIRVGILASEIAKFKQLDKTIDMMRLSLMSFERTKNALERAELFAGLLHDIGKIFVPEYLLTKGSLSYEEIQQMKVHVQHSYSMLSKRHPFSAEIIIRHHRYQKDPYPEELPKPSISFESESASLYIIESCARVLAIADHYDAYRYRNNERNEHGKLSPEKIKALLSEEFPKNMIDSLYESGILGI